MTDDLLTLMRENDLPPRWDGRVVVWEGWKDSMPNVFICPPTKRDVCPNCGSGEPSTRNRGLVAKKRSTTLDTIEGTARAHQVGRVATWRLFAFRCTNCHHDQVWDMDLNELWDLDHTDYGPEGSRA
jgi:Zn finger protein HypA/HybF involved in hydrogenase expression